MHLNPVLECLGDVVWSFSVVRLFERILETAEPFRERLRLNRPLFRGWDSEQYALREIRRVRPDRRWRWLACVGSAPVGAAGVAAVGWAGFWTPVDGG